MAAPESTKIQISITNGIPMINLYASNPTEADELIEWQKENQAEIVTAAQEYQATWNATNQLPATVTAVIPNPAPAALPQVQPAFAQAAPAVAAPAAVGGHTCDCGEPMSLKTSSFGSFYACNKPMKINGMANPQRCSKKINV